MNVLITFESDVSIGNYTICYIILRRKIIAKITCHLNKPSLKRCLLKQASDASLVNFQGIYLFLKMDVTINVIFILNASLGIVNSVDGDFLGTYISTYLCAYNIKT